MIKGLSGATIWSEDLTNKLLPFYRDTLGLKPHLETDGFVLFGNPPGAFALGTHSEVKGQNADPARHMVGFLTDDIESEVGRLKAKGVEFVSDLEKFPQVTVATLKDPEGNYIQLLQFV